MKAQKVSNIRSGPWIGPDICAYLETLHAEGVQNVLQIATPPGSLPTVMGADTTPVAVVITDTVPSPT